MRQYCGRKWIKKEEIPTEDRKTLIQQYFRGHKEMKKCRYEARERGKQFAIFPHFFVRGAAACGTLHSSLSLKRKEDFVTWGSPSGDVRITSRSATPERGIGSVSRSWGATLSTVLLHELHHRKRSSGLSYP